MTARGKFVITLIILLIAGLGSYQWWEKNNPNATGTPGTNPGPAAQASAGGSTDKTPDASGPKLDEASFITPQHSCPVLPPAGTYVPKDNTLDLDISEYAGYAGLIVANGGLEPSENSYFFKKHGFKVRISVSEESTWGSLNSGKFAASATTVDVITAHCRNFAVVSPVQIGFSRGADGIVVRKDIRRINDLKGKILSTEQFTEGDFFIRYLAQEAGLSVNLLDTPTSKPKADQINLLFASDAFAAADLFLKDVKAGGKLLAGCVTWAPKTTETVDASGGAAHLLTTNKNLLIVADIMVVNKGFAQANPKMVAGLVDGVLYGNDQVRDKSTPAVLDTVGKAFKWDAAQTKEELAKVHLSNLPENLAFYSGSIDSAGSFSGIFSSAILAYGSLLDQPADAERYMDVSHLTALKAAGAYAGQAISIAPIRGSSGSALENDPLLTKDIRFFFEPNSSNLQLTNKENLDNLDSIKRLLQVSPGSTILLRGHVDNGRIADIRKEGGEGLVRQFALQAMELSKKRANEIRRVLTEKLQVPAVRLETIGRGWEEPAGTDPEKNRRVEVQWFTLE